MRFINGDTLVARITPCLENGKTAFVDFLEEGQVAWGSTEYIVLHPKVPLPEEFAYCLARNDNFRDFAIQSMNGSSGRQRVPAESLSQFLLVLPSDGISALFSQQIKPL
jgi:type I restriction enzyme S subunit